MTYIFAIMGGLAGAALGWTLTAAAALAISGYMGVSDFEGARAMGAIWGIGPIGGLVGLVAGVWLVLRYRGGHKGFKALAVRLPFVIASIAGLVAATFGALYWMRPILNDNGPAPQLAFEIRLPPGEAPPADAAVTLFTERNSMPGTIDAGTAHRDGDRPVLTGTVELYYRSSWRLLELKAAGLPEHLFVLRLAARPGNDAEFRDWEHVSNVGNDTDRPRKATDADAYDIRYRVVWPGEGE